MKTGHLDIRVEQGLIDRIDAWRNRQPIPPSRASAIAYILKHWLEPAPATSVPELPLVPPEG